MAYHSLHAKRLFFNDRVHLFLISAGDKIYLVNRIFRCEVAAIVGKLQLNREASIRNISLNGNASILASERFANIEQMFFQVSYHRPQSVPKYACSVVVSS